MRKVTFLSGTPFENTNMNTSRARPVLDFVWGKPLVNHKTVWVPRECLVKFEKNWRPTNITIWKNINFAFQSSQLDGTCYQTKPLTNSWTNPLICLKTPGQISQIIPKNDGLDTFIWRENNKNTGTQARKYCSFLDYPMKNCDFSDENMDFPSQTGWSFFEGRKVNFLHCPIAIFHEGGEVPPFDSSYSHRSTDQKRQEGRPQKNNNWKVDPFFMGTQMFEKNLYIMWDGSMVWLHFRWLGKATAFRWHRPRRTACHCGWCP